MGYLLGEKWGSDFGLGPEICLRRILKAVGDRLSNDL